MKGTLGWIQPLRIPANKRLKSIMNKTCNAEPRMSTIQTSLALGLFPCPLLPQVLLSAPSERNNTKSLS